MDRVVEAGGRIVESGDRFVEKVSTKSSKTLTDYSHTPATGRDFSVRATANLLCDGASLFEFLAITNLSDFTILGQDR